MDDLVEYLSIGLLVLVVWDYLTPKRMPWEERLKLRRQDRFRRNLFRARHYLPQRWVKQAIKKKSDQKFVSNKSIYD